MKKILLLLFILVVNYGQSQTCTNIVGGSDFSAVAGFVGDWSWVLTNINQKGPTGNAFAIDVPYFNNVTDFSGATAGYVVTDNPSKLRTDFPSVADDMLVIKIPNTSDTHIFSFTVPNLKPASNYTFKMRLYTLPKNGSTCFNNHQWYAKDLQIGVNGTLSAKNLDKYGSYEDIIINGTLAAGESTLVFDMKTGYNGNGTCMTLGISNIEVIGCINPTVKSSQGNEVCTGEQVLLSPDKDYNGISYKWEKSTNGGSVWSLLANSVNVIDEVKATVQYRLTIDGVTSSPQEIKTITCCEDPITQASSSREVIFFDDFGRFTNATSYTDAFGKTGTGTNYRANVIGYTIPSHTYDPTGQVDDGTYAVACYPPKYLETWYGAVPTDHSGELNGGCLFINVQNNFKGIIYNRQIDNLCDGKQLYFEAYFANASNVDPPVINLSIKTLTGNLLAQSGNTTIAKNTGWVQIKVPVFTLSGGNTSVKVEINSQGGNWTTGNDLLMDDIKFMVCSPPALDLFTDKTNLLKELSVCSNPVVLDLQESALLKAYYGNDPRFLYQWTATPTVKTSWQNLGSPSTTTTYSISDPKNSAFFLSKSNGDKVYFRVIAAMASIFTSNNDFQGANYADPANYCKNYTISPNTILSLDCPTCKKADAYSIASTIADLGLCKEESSTTLSLGPLKYNGGTTATATDLDITWYKGATIAAGTVVKATATSNSSSYAVAWADSNTYWVRVRDAAPTMQSQSSCWIDKSVKVTGHPVPIPVPSATNSGTVCEGTTLALDVSTTPANTYTYLWTGPVAITSSTTKNPTVSTAATTAMAGSYKVKVTSANNCTADATVVITVQPAVTAGVIAADQTICYNTTPAALTSTTAGAGGNGTMSYQWQSSTNGGTTWTDISIGGASATYAPGALTATTKYQRKVTAGTLCPEKITTPLTVTVNAQLTAGSVGYAQTICSTTKPTAFTELTAPTGGTGSYTYQWQNSIDGGITWTDISGATSATYTQATALTATTDYRRNVTSGTCGTVNSASFKITVTPLPAAPTFTVNPVKYCKDATAIPLTATGSTITWYSDATIATSISTPTPITTAVGTTSYYASQTVSSCEGPRAQLDVTINALPTVNAGTDYTICKTDAAALDATTTSTVTPLTYAWSCDANTILSSPTGSSVTGELKIKTISADEPHTYTVTLTDGNGCKGNDAIIITYQEQCAPTVQILAKKNPLCFGESTTVDITITSKKGLKSVKIGDGTTTQDLSSSIIGVGPTYTFTNIPIPSVTLAITSPNITTYSVTATDNSTPSSDGTGSIVITVNPLPTVSVNNPQVCPNTGATLTTTVTGEGGYNYLWDNGTASTTASITINPAVVQTYKVTVTDKNNCVTNAQGTVSLRIPPAVSLGGDFSICKDDAAPLVATSTPAGLTNYTWAYDATNITFTGTGANVTGALKDNNISANTPYTYTVTVTDGNSCTGTDNIIVTYESVCRPYAYIKTSKPKICLGESYDVWVEYKSQNPVSKIEWTSHPAFNTTAPFTTPGPHNTETPLVTGDIVYIVYIEDNLGKFNGDTLTMTVNSLPIPAATNDGPKCKNQTLNLTATPTGLNYSWTGPSSYVSNLEKPLISPADPSMSGDYTVVVTDGNGCSDQIKTTVTINPLPTVSVANVQICKSDQATLVTDATTATGWVWSEGSSTTSQLQIIPATSPKTYTVTVTDINGCQSNASGTVTFFDLPVATLPKDTSICKDYNLTITVTGNGNKFQWSDPLETTQSLTKIQSSTQTYTVTITTIDNCKATDEIVVTVNQLPTAQITGDTIICLGQQTTLTVSNKEGTAITQYLWNPGGQQITPDYLVSPTSKTSYTVTITDSHTCTAEDTVTVTVNPLPTITFQLLPQPQLCVSETLFTLNQVTATPTGGTGVYSGPGVTGTNFDASAAGVSAKHTITYTYTDLNTCQSSKTQDITVEALPIKPAIPDPICLGDTRTLDANNAGAKFKWSTPGSDTSQTINVTPDSATTMSYRVTISKGNCVSTDTVTLLVNPLPDVKYTTAGTYGCAPFTAVFTDSTLPKGKSYEWDFGDGIKLTNQSGKVSHKYNKSGSYTIQYKVTTLVGCVDTIKRINAIEVMPIPIPNFGYSPTTPTNFSPEVEFKDLSKGNVKQWVWDFGDPGTGDNNKIEQNPMHSFSKPGKYAVQLIAISGDDCRDTTYQTVIVKADHTLYAPNAFTPNSDGHNENFIPKGVGLEDISFELYVFSRWGELIYSTTDINAPWDGKKFNAGKVLPSDVYSWVCKFKDLEGKDFSYTGSVLLLK